MSSYLVAMAVGDFQCVDGETERRPDSHLRDAGQNASSDTSRSTPPRRFSTFYNRLLRHQISLRETRRRRGPRLCGRRDGKHGGDLLPRGRSPRRFDKPPRWRTCKRIWAVLAHEMAHQWFGDLVTMQWWDDLWLNEGFATWMEKRPLAALKPDWKMDVEAASDTLAAMNLDSLASTRAIHTTVETPDEIEGSFDNDRLREGRRGDAHGRGLSSAPTPSATASTRTSRQHAYGNATSAGLLDGDDDSVRQAGRSHSADLRQPAGRAAGPGRSHAATAIGRSLSLTITSAVLHRRRPWSKTAPGTPQLAGADLHQDAADRATPRCQVVSGPHGDHPARHAAVRVHAGRS